MRKTDVRKWIHAVLDMLPLIVIPVFMVYSHRHTIDNYTLEVEESEVVDFNQQYGVAFRDNYTLGDFTFVNNGDGSVTINGANSSNNNIDLPIQYSDTSIKSNHLYFWGAYGGNLTDSYFLITQIAGTYNTTNNNQTYGFDLISRSVNGFSSLIFRVLPNTTLTDFTIKPMLIDFTQMFGVGNEPTIQQFIEWYPNNYYDYTLSDKQLLYTGNYITYDSTDVGSQFFYTLYNTTDKYFNFGNTFGFNNLYDWLNLNVFNGQAPLSVFVVWNIFLYEFLMDLIFLLYALFMFFIDFCTNLIERFYCSARGGR